MAGLLDDLPNYWGDSTTKDPGTGLTQADRRDPLWAGLIQGGMGLLAAGQDITPAARAQMIAQAGQTYGGIPGAMMAQRSAGAQQVLQQQQIKAGAAKLGAAERLAALAKTPEFQTAVAKLEPHERMLLQAALDAGDMAHAQQILSGAGKAELREREIDIKAKTADLRAKEADARAGGLWKGTNPEMQMLGVLAEGMTNPAVVATEAYAQAYDRLSKERQTVINGQVVTSPPMDMSRYPVPTAPAAPGSTAAQPTDPPPPVGEPRTNKDGSVTTTATDGTFKTDFPDGSVKQYDKNGKLLRKIDAKPPDAADVRDFNKFEADASTTIAALDDFRDEARKASPEDKLKALAGVPTAQRQAHTLAALLLKGDVLLSLGVLTGEDMELLRSVLPDPSTFRGTFGDYAVGVEKARKLIAQKMALRERQVYPHGRPGSKPTGSPGKIPAYVEDPPGSRKFRLVEQ